MLLSCRRGGPGAQSQMAEGCGDDGGWGVGCTHSSPREDAEAPPARAPSSRAASNPSTRLRFILRKQERRCRPRTLRSV